MIQHSICGRPTGVIGVVPDGGIPPYTYEWSNFQQEQVIGGLTAGFYSVTVFDSMGESASGGGTIQDLSSYPSGFLNSYQVPMSYCDGESPRVAIWHGVTNGQSPPPEDIYGPMPYAPNDHPDLVDVVIYPAACAHLPTWISDGCWSLMLHWTRIGSELHGWRWLSGPGGCVFEAAHRMASHPVGRGRRHMLHGIGWNGDRFGWCPATPVQPEQRRGGMTRPR
ncbi:MAG: SprB repeat-containing protein [Flavobacteriales bacterium]|nr:SprB repeat-containing protein [Flavobacteriales bacterium]